jgi:hypothetical protein
MNNSISTFALVLFLLAGVFPRPAAAAEPQWKASWITHPTAPLREPLVLHFRRSLQLDTKPARYVVHVSADNRFILYVNGHRVGMGRRAATWRIGGMRLSIWPSISPREQIS